MLPKLLKLFAFIVIYTLVQPQFAVAGDSRGGGNTLPQNLASKGDVEDAIRGVKAPLTIFFKSERWLAGPGYPRQGPNDIIGRTFDKLFNNPANSTVKHTVLDEISVFGFDIRQTGPCKDLDGKEVDASAFNTDSNKICFSLERLSQKLSRGELEDQIIALAAHEVSHRVGTTEEEAEMLQGLAIERLTAWHPNLVMQQESLQKKYEDVIGFTNSIVKGIDSAKKDAEICYYLSDLRSVALDANTVFYTAFNNNMISFLPHEIKPTVDALGVKSVLVAGFCLSEVAPEDRKTLRREVIEIRELAKQILNSFY